MRTAENPVGRLHTVSQNSAAAVRTLRGQLHRRTFDAVERRGAAVAEGHGERLVVVVAAGITNRHAHADSLQIPGANSTPGFLGSVSEFGRMRPRPAAVGFVEEPAQQFTSFLL